MQQNQLDGIATFIAVAEEKAFSAAAVKPGISPSAVSQTIRSFERRVGQALFNRNTRGGQPDRSRRELLSTDTARSARTRAGLEGTWRRRRSPCPAATHQCSARRAYDRASACFAAVSDRYPEIRLDGCIENSLVDIVGRGFDAGIRFGDLVERDMVAIKVGPPIRAWMVACLRRAAMRSAHPSAHANGSP
ncbi:LysR family transcriptional regulator [Paraburkholderia xenovorans]|uniref:LysR family transcriptional regulator n=1 Tax=Paraburkholderia xenovorans TaxID=36873 RepID=UPI0038B9B410